MSNLNAKIAIYTTRPFGANQETATYEQNYWITQSVLWSVQLSIVLWSLYGVYTLGRLVFT